MRWNIKDEIGRQFDRLTVIARGETNKRGGRLLDLRMCMRTAGHSFSR
jgi:hypothetical protein